MISPALLAFLLHHGRFTCGRAGPHGSSEFEGQSRRSWRMLQAAVPYGGDGPREGAILDPLGD